MEREVVIVNNFCTVLKDFLTDMYKSYPDNSLLLLKNMTDAMIFSNPRGVVKNYMLCVKSYQRKILAKDEDFFLNGELENDLSSGEYSFLLDELKKICNIWRDSNTSLNTKNAIWKYLQVLINLGNKLSLT